MTPRLYDHNGRLRTWIMTLALLLLGFLAYSPAFNGPFIWDDSIWLVDNAAVKHENLSWIWRGYRSASQYYPLTVTTYWFEYRIWGLWTPGYRAVNILLHVTSAFLLWKLLTRLKIPGATLAALIWAIHPMQVESVVWITERKNTLSGVFFFAALLTWLDVVTPEISRRKRAGMYLATVGLFLAALLSKTSTVFLPVAMIGIAWIYSGRLQIRHIARTIPFFAIGILMGLFTIYSERMLAFGEDNVSAWSQTPVQRFILAGKCFWFYIGKLLWPAELAQIYPLWSLDSSNPIEYLWIGGAIVLFILLGIYTWRRRDSRFLVAAVFYLAGIFPVIGFLKFYTQLYTFTADHYCYLSCAAVIAVFAGLLTSAWKWLSQKYTLKPMLSTAAASTIVLSLTIRSLSQSMVYQEYITFWLDTLRVNPRAWAALSNIGCHYNVVLNQPEEAMQWFEKAVAIYPQPPLTLFYMGNASEKLGRLDDAMAYYRKAIQADPSFAEPYLHLSRMLLNRQEYQQTVQLLLQAVEQSPANVDLWVQLAVCKRALNKWDEAAHFCHYALEFDPDHAPAIFELGLIYANQNNNPRALKALAAAVELEPESFEYRRNYAIVLKRLGQEEEAQRQMKIALELRAKEQQKKTQP